jgi:uncharacterized protein YkwD
MHTSIRQDLYPCPRGRAAAAWCGIVILALTLLGSSVARAASHRKAVKAPASTPPASCTNTNLQPTGSNLAAIDAATFCLIEQVRSTNYLPSLHLSYSLQRVATGQTQDMVAGDYFGDDSISGLTPMQRILATPYPSHAARVNSAQNIGWATGPLATPAGMVEAWMHSPPHREIILTARFRDIGVGVTPAAPSSLANGLEGATYTLELGERVFSAKVAKTKTTTKKTKKKH